MEESIVGQELAGKLDLVFSKSLQMAKFTLSSWVSCLLTTPMSIADYYPILVQISIASAMGA